MGVCVCVCVCVCVYHKNNHRKRGHGFRGLREESVLCCWTKRQLLVSSVIVGHQELATCHLFFEQNQLFLHGPFGVTVDDGSG